MRKSTLAAQLMRTTILTGAAVAFVTPAFAQDEEEDEIVVTGSRIAREDLAAPSPVTTVDAQQLVLTNTVNSEQFLNTLPQVIPSFDSTSNNPGDGTATVNLRGLGTNRTLVLVDGSRFVASGPGGVVDLNAIPAALVERIDVVTGGASAVYGSDAVAGVVNFILKDDFEGVQLDVSNELSASGWDANIFNAALTLGGNFADGRGNAIMSVSYTNREALFQGDRGPSSIAFLDPGLSGPGVSNTTFAPGGSGSALGGQFISLANRNRGTMSTADDELGGFLNAGGTLFYPAPGGNNVTFNGAPGGRRYNAAGGDLYNYAPTNYLQLPQERYSIFAGGTYEINENVEVYARGVFAQSTVDSQLAPTPVGGTFTLNLDNPNIPANFLTALQQTYNFAGSAPAPGFPTGQPADVQDRDGDGEVDDILISISRRYNDDSIGPRNSLRDSSTFQIKGGLRGDLGEDWNWDVYGQFGRVSATQSQTGNISFSALQDGILSGDVNIFGINTIDAAAGELIRRTAIIFDTVEQIQVVGTLSGTLDTIKSPFAESGIGLAFGVEYREEEAVSLPDSVLGPDIRGFNSQLPVAGSFDVYEAFMEADIPLIEDSFIGDLGINGAFRYSDYSTQAVGSTISFAAGVNWAPIEELRIRGQFQRASRAPNIGELFSAFSNGFPGANDPCSGGGFGSFVAANAANCSAFGVPVPGDPFQLSGQIEALFGGNPFLFEETADTYTAGFVWQSSFIDGLTVQADYYDISITDAISGVPLQLLLDECYVGGNTGICNNFFGPGTRDPSNGQITAPFLPRIGQLNIAGITARGIDATISYGTDIGNLGSLSLQYYGNYTLESNFQVDQDDPTTLIECAGRYAGNCGEPTPEYKHTMQASWLYGALTSSVRWRYIGGTDSDISAGSTLINDAATCNAPGNPSPTVDAGFETCLSDLSDDIKAFNYVDVTLGYAVSENLDLTVGVQNIFGKDAPLLSSTVDEQANTYPATYETLGRSLFFAASLKF